MPFPRAFFHTCISLCQPECRNRAECRTSPINTVTSESFWPTAAASSESQSLSTGRRSTSSNANRDGMSTGSSSSPIHSRAFKLFTGRASAASAPGPFLLVVLLVC
jgi:hypothetical protein